MQLTEHRELWKKIQNFPLDEPGSVIRFSDKLAAKQHWSKEYTFRVIEEYQRFLFLTCILPNGASPSKAVDEAWHLHLTYTKSYWEDLCRNTLGKDIHHYPSKGGAQEDQKHADWYYNTLQQYKRVFGFAAPEDIWPPSSLHAIGSIEKPAFSFDNSLILVLLLIYLFPFIAIFLVTGKWFPFDLAGPDFLWFFPLLLICLLSGHWIIQARKRQYNHAIAEKYFNACNNVFRRSRFLYGKHRAIQAAIVDLLRRDLLELARDKKFIVHNRRYVKRDNEENPFVPFLLKAPDGEVLNYEELSVSWYDEASFCRSLPGNVVPVCPPTE